MFAGVTALVAAVALLPLTVAQQDKQYTVWSSVIFSRTGDRTPLILGDIPTTLTSLGAQQAYSAGAFFRNRYIASVPNLFDNSSESEAQGIDKAPLWGLSAESVDVQQLYAQALDTQASVASAQAFLQGFYPPFVLNESMALTMDPTSVLANGTFVESPLDGYQYAQIHTSGALDPEYVYVGGSLDCPAFDYADIEYTTSQQFGAIAQASKSTYGQVGGPLLSDVLPSDGWDYLNAYAIYDYVNYHATHNATFAALLSDPSFIANTNTNYLSALRYLADEQQYAILGNLSAYNNLTTDSTALPDGISGSISTIAGNMLLAKMLAQLQIAIETQGEYYKLSLLFGDYEPLVSLFALTSLPTLNSNFYGLPQFASTAVFELFSWTNETNMDFPSTTDDLWVRFYFRNGTDSDDDFQSYPLFGQGPSETDMSWNDFESEMSGLIMPNVGDWCTQCGANNIFCAAWNGSDAATSSSSTSPNHHHGGVSPTVAGVIGAIVALVVAGLLFGLAMLLGGVRLHRNKSHKQELGGFKGSAKLASDRDLTMPKGGAVVGATVERSPTATGGHERVGSWEMKDAEISRHVDRRPSLEEEEEEARRVNPFADPVKPDERV